jgi:hypothetical protein
MTNQEFDRRMDRLTVTAAFIAFLALAGCQTVLVSEGDRIGQLTKLSHKMLCTGHWSWEGELAMAGGTLAGGQGQTEGGQTTVSAWAFSVANEELAASLKELLGRNVRLHYLQYQNQNSCEMGSEYKVTEVQSLDGK